MQQIQILDTNDFRHAMISVFLNFCSSEMKLSRFKTPVVVIVKEDVITELDANGVTTLVEGIIYVVIDSSMAFSDMIMTLAHEMWHVKQFLTGVLAINTAGDWTWAGSTKHNELPYLERPWEIQAIKESEYLFRRFEESHFIETSVVLKPEAGQDVNLELYID